MTETQSSDYSERRRALAGVLKGQVKMASDFNETPDMLSVMGYLVILCASAIMFYRNRE